MIEHGENIQQLGTMLRRDAAITAPFMEGSQATMPKRTHHLGQLECRPSLVKRHSYGIKRPRLNGVAAALGTSIGVPLHSLIARARAPRSIAAETSRPSASLWRISSRMRDSSGVTLPSAAAISQASA